MDGQTIGPTTHGATRPSSEVVPVPPETRYSLLERIGEGGMADVYRARHNALGKDVAVKVLKPSYAGDPVISERFIREGKALSRVQHENVVAVTDIGTTSDGSVLMVMELLVGEGLHKLLDREGPLPWSRARIIALQICRALHAAHQHGVVHRDMKPENCWRTKRGANKDFIKVLDFGIAKMRSVPGDNVQSLTATGEVFGTPEYMSPEQALGQRSDERSDVYAVGVMLYRMATGILPFTGRTAVAILGKQIHEQPPPPRTHAGDKTCPRTLEAIILRALSKDPNERYQTMKDLAEALAAGSVLRPHGGNPSRRMILWVVLAVIVGCMVALILVKMSTQ